MKILFATNSLNPSYAGGARVLLESELDLLAKAGHQVITVCGDSLSLSSRLNQAKTYFVPKLQLRFLGNKGDGFQSIVLRENPDLIHFHVCDSYSYKDTIIWSSRQKPIAFTAHNHLLTCPNMRRFSSSSIKVCNLKSGLICWQKAIQDGCYYRHPIRFLRNFRKYKRFQESVSKLTNVITYSEYMENTLIQAGFFQKKVKMLYPAFNKNEVSVRDYIYPKNLILYVGRLSYEKGIQLLLQACKIMTLDYNLYIIGDGNYRRELEKLAGGLGISSRLIFRGWVSASQLATFYSRAKVLVVPSIWPEPFGLIGPEAMAHGCPVVAFDVGGISDWLIDGQSGFLVPVGNVKELAYRIEQLLGNPELANEMGRKGSELVREKFSPENHLRGLLSIYEKAIISFNR